MSGKSGKSGPQPLVMEVIIEGVKRSRKTAVELIVNKGDLRVSLPKTAKTVPRVLKEMNLYYKAGRLQVVCPFCAQHRRAGGLLFWDRCAKCGAYLYFGYAGSIFACFALGRLEEPAPKVLSPR